MGSISIKNFDNVLKKEIEDIELKKQQVIQDYAKEVNANIDKYTDFFKENCKKINKGCSVDFVETSRIGENSLSQTIFNIKEKYRGRLKELNEEKEKLEIANAQIKKVMKEEYDFLRDEINSTIEEFRKM